MRLAIQSFCFDALQSLPPFMEWPLLGGEDGFQLGQFDLFLGYSREQSDAIRGGFSRRAWSGNKRQALAMPVFKTINCRHVSHALNTLTETKPRYRPLLVRVNATNRPSL